MIKIIAACSSNRVIGKDNTLIWKVPGDLKRFKEMTTGHTVVMGRLTYESIGKPLPNRTNVIITRNPEYKVEGCEVIYNGYTALKEILNRSKNEDIFIIGGGNVYSQFLPYADVIELTYIDKEFEGDTFFPEIPNTFLEVKREDLECKDFNYSYITYYSYTLHSNDITTEGWELSGVAMNGGSKYFIKNDYMLTYNGENRLFLKEKKGLVPRIEIVKMNNQKKNKVLFEGDVFNKQQLKDTLSVIDNSK